MGNLQTGDSKQVKIKSKTKVKLRGKKGKIEEGFVAVVPEISEKEEEEPPPEKTVLVTDSWCEVNNLTDDPQIKKLMSPNSSSDSNFTDPQTPSSFPYQSGESIHLEVEIPSTIQESFLHDLTLNSFKLNEYRARHEVEKTKKLSKLGVSKTSQISLDSNPDDCFVSDNVEIVNKDDKAEEETSLERDDTLKRRSKEDDNQVSRMVKRMSDVSITNGEQRWHFH